jgi:hypothetical protein
VDEKYDIAPDETDPAFEGAPAPALAWSVGRRYMLYVSKQHHPLHSKLFPDFQVSNNGQSLDYTIKQNNGAGTFNLEQFKLNYYGVSGAQCGPDRKPIITPEVRDALFRTLTTHFTQHEAVDGEPPQAWHSKGHWIHAFAFQDKKVLLRLGLTVTAAALDKTEHMGKAMAGIIQMLNHATQITTANAKQKLHFDNKYGVSNFERDHAKEASVYFAKASGDERTQFLGTMTQWHARTPKMKQLWPLGAKYYNDLPQSSGTNSTSISEPNVTVTDSQTPLSKGNFVVEEQYRHYNVTTGAFTHSEPRLLGHESSSALAQGFSPYIDSVSLKKGVPTAILEKGNFVVMPQSTYYRNDWYESARPSTSEINGIPASKLKKAGRFFKFMSSDAGFGPIALAFQGYNIFDSISELETLYQNNTTQKNTEEVVSLCILIRDGLESTIKVYDSWQHQLKDEKSTLSRTMVSCSEFLERHNITWPKKIKSPIKSLIDHSHFSAHGLECG